MVSIFVVYVIVVVIVLVVNHLDFCAHAIFGWQQLVLFLGSVYDTKFVVFDEEIPQAERTYSQEVQNIPLKFRFDRYNSDEELQKALFDAFLRPPAITAGYYFEKVRMGEWENIRNFICSPCL